MEQPRNRRPAPLAAPRRLASLLTAAACAASSALASAQPAPDSAPSTPSFDLAPQTPSSAQPAPDSAPPTPPLPLSAKPVPPDCTTELPWMWGFPAPQGGPVWYVIPERAPAPASFSEPASVAPPSLPQCDKTLRWAWGFPAPQGGPTWYVAPGAPLSTAPVPEKPKPPRGPRDSLKRRLMLAGSIGLGLCGVGVSFPYVSAAQTYGFDTSWALLTVPVAGPFLAAGFAERVHDPSNSLQVPFLIAGGVVETAFFATLIAGLALPGGDTPAAPAEPSDTRSPSPPTLTFGVAPSVSGDGGGLLFHGTF